MRTAALLLASGLLLGGCHTAKNVAVTTFRVIDAPAAYVRHQIERVDQPRTTTTTTTRTASSDVITPGRPIVRSTPPAQRKLTTTTQRRTASSSPTPRPARSSTPAAQTQPPASQTAEYPTAKPVPGKPGFVFSPFDANGGYVDVTGYQSGSKAKDPYSQKVFIVP